MAKFSEWIKNREEEEEKKSSSPYSKNDYARYRAEKSIGLDTFESDLANMNTTLSGIVGGWQTQETMANTRSAVESMYKRTTDYQNYLSKYQPDAKTNIGDISSYYKNALDSWDSLSEAYGYYKDADSYSKAMKKVELDNKFSGKTYDEVQAEMKKYSPDSDEYKYLSGYTGYSDLKDFDKALASAGDDVKKDIETARNKYALDNKFDLYSDIMKNPDYAEKSQYKSTQNQKKFLGMEFTDYGDETYEFINNVDDARTNLIAKYKEGNGATELEQHGYEYMTDDEIGVFNYLYGKGSEEEKKQAYKYLEDLEISLNKRSYENTTGKWKEMAGKNPLSDALLSGATTIYNIAGGIGNALATADELVTGKEYNPYAPLRMPSNATTDIRQYVGEGIAEKTEGMELFGQNIPSFLYQSGMSIADSMLGVKMLGNGYSAVMASNAFQQTAKEMVEAGESPEVVIASGAVSAYAEYVFEKYGIDKMLKIKNADSLKNIIKSTLKQAVAEGYEEAGTEFINILSDTILRGDRSELKTKAQELRDRGFSESEINTEIAKQIASQIGWATAGGALSGLVMGGTFAGNQYHDLGTTGKQIMENETASDLMELAGGLTNKESEAYKLYTEYANKGLNADNITPARVGNLYNAVESDVRSEYKSARANDIMRSVANKANEFGDSKNSGLIASAIQKKTDGQRLSSEERTALKSDTAQAILQDGVRVKASDEFDNALANMKRTESIITPKTEAEKARLQELKKLKTGEKTVNAEGNEVTIEGVKTENGATTIQTSQGEVLASEMTFSSSDAEIVSYAQNMTAEKADLFVKMYDGKMNVDDYATSFDLAYSYGENKMDLSNALSNRGVLTEAQALKVYEAGNVGRAIAKQKVVDEINKKYAGKTFIKGKLDDSIIDYEGHAEGKVAWADLTERQKKSLNFLRAFAEVTGSNIVLINSEIVNGKHVGQNGRYQALDNPKNNTKGNTMYIDVFAGRIDASTMFDAIVPTLSHEVTHWMKAKAPAMYQKMQDYLLTALAERSGHSLNYLIAKEKARLMDKHPDQNYTDEDAIDELVARGCEDMLANSEKVRELLGNMSESEQKTFIDKVKETFQNIIDWVNELLGQYDSKSDEAKMLRQYKNRVTELSKMWDEALTEAIKTNQSMKQMEAEGATNKQIYEALMGDGISEDGTTIIGENVAQMSERTYEDGGREYLEKWLMKKTKGKKATITEEDAKDILDQTDAIYRIMQDIKKGNDLPDYAKWAETNVTTDEDGKKISVIVKNGDYSMNLDVGLVCKKRIALNAVLNALVQSNDLSVYTLTETDVAELNAIIKKHEFEIACALCFVDSKRYRVGSWANSFCEGTEDKDGKKYGFNEMVRSLVPKGSNLQIDEFNFTGRNIINQPTENLLKNAKDSELDFTLIDQIMKDNPPAKNGAKNAQYRYAEAIKNNKDLRSILNPSEIISSIGLDAIRLEQKNLYSLINGHQGTAKPKFAHLSVAFKNDILRATSWTVDRAKMVGGVRLQSFSDFMANMVFDYAQMISELSAKQLTAHAYTKEPLFVKLFGLTGIKINMSLVPKVDLTPEQIKRFKNMTDAQKEADAEYQMLKKTAGLRINENGEAEYVWEDETFPYDVAMDIMADKRYTKNCGTIAVGISSAHIRKLLADDRISMVIPYHKSGLNHMVAEMRNIALYNDYTSVQNTRYASGEKLDKKKDKDFDFYGDLYGTKKKDGTHDPKQTAENYKKWCEENGYLPKFDEFKDDANYYKLLIDFTVYDINDNMKYTEQEAVKPVYPSDAEFKDLIVNGVVKNGVTYGGLKQAQDDSTRLDQETNQIIDELREVLKKKYGEDVLKSQYSDRTAPIEDDDYKNMVKHFGTTGNFNVAGYMLQDGKILDFSGKHWGDTTSRSRQVDHRDIQEVLSDDNNGVDSMVRMISNGNIRLMPETGGINLAVAPSKNQRTVLRRYIEYFKGDIVVDIDAVGGDTVESFRYDKGTSADRIMRDIDNYFRGGRQSELMRFHTQYSDRDYLDAVNRGDMETAQKMVDEVAKAKGYSEKVYHGTDAEFTIFETGISGGIYMATNKKVAEGFSKNGNVKSLYTKFNNPMVINALIPPADVWGGYKMPYYWEIPTPKEMLSTGKYGDTVATEEISVYAQKNGYDGVIIHNMKEGNNLGTSDYIAFAPNQIKSADPVTYDDNGNVIPLSERFNTENEDIRYSDRDLGFSNRHVDEFLASLDADELLDLFWGDVTDTPKKQRAKRRVDEVKKRLDAIGLTFNGTKSLGLTDERIEQYLREFGASNPNYAQAYIAYMTPQQFLNLTVGGKTTTMDMIESESASYGEIDFEKLGRSGSMFLDINEKDGKAKVTGHEGRHRMLLLGKAGFERIPVLLFDYRTKYNKTAKDSLKLTTQRYNDEDFISKTRDTVIHDLVPLSTGNRDLVIQKFGSGVEADVHYSDRDYTSVYELMGEKDTLDEENRKLKADIEKLKATIGSEDVKIARFRSLADYLKKLAGSNYSREALGDALKNLYNYIQTTDDLKWYNVMAKAEEIANDMMQLNVPINYFREVMTDIRQDKVSLSEEQYAEAVKLYGSYGNLHKALFGSINLTKSGKPLEEQWKDWSKAFPTVFKADISAVDMVKELRDTVDALKNTSAVMGEYERQEAIRHLGIEIYNQFWNIASDSSEAVKKVKADHREMMQKMRQDYQKRQAEKTLHPEGELALKYEKLLKDTIKRDRDQMQRIRELGKKRVDNFKERAEKNALIQKITTKSTTLRKWLATPNKKEHVPEPLVPIVRNFLDAIDYSSKRYLEHGIPTEKDKTFAKALSKLQRAMNNSNRSLGSEKGDGYLKAFFPEDLVQEIGELVDRVEEFIPDTTSGEYVLNQMSLADLKLLDYLVSVLKSSVTNMNKFFGEKHTETISDLSHGGMVYRKKLGTDKEYADWRQKFKKTFNWNNTNPLFAFKWFGEDGRKIFESIQDGWDKFAFNVKNIIDYAKQSYTEKEIEEWRKDIKRNIEISGDRKVTMSVPQIMSLYCLQKREQALKHMIGEGKGIHVGDIEDGKNVIRQTEGTGQITKNDIEIITSKLTKRQKEVADRLQAFMNEVCAKWGNEVTMKLYGFLGFTEANYFPIKTDDNYLASEPAENENSMFRLLNMSFTKSINENANNKIMVLDIFDVFAQHTSDMAKYNALALPVYDAFRWYSYKENTGDNAYSVKASLETAFGKDGKAYAYSFFKDINGSQNVGRDALGTQFFTNAKIASVGANLKVMALQPTSYARAGAIIDAKYLIPAMASKAKYETVMVNGKAEKQLLAEKYCGIVQWKALGFYDTNIQRGVADLIKHEQTWKDKAVELSMKGAEKADEFTLGRLWNACEAEVKDKQKNLKVGSEEFYNAVGLRLREVVYNTQVVDSTMTRSQMMRSGDKWDKVTSAFMSEPTLSYNMLLDAYMDFKLAERETGSKQKAFKKHGKKAIRTITAYTVTNIFTALLEAGFAGLRDEDDETMTAEEFLKQFWSNLLANMSLLGKIPYVKDVISNFQGYSSDRMDTQWAKYASYSVSGIKNLLEGEGGNPYKIAKNAVKAYSYLSGLPLYNFLREIKTIFNFTGILEAEELEEMFNDIIGDMYPSLKIK